VPRRWARAAQWLNRGHLGVRLRPSLHSRMTDIGIWTKKLREAEGTCRFDETQRAECCRQEADASQGTAEAAQGQSRGLAMVRARRALPKHLVLFVDLKP
jgi:hypothetical protein